MQKELLNQHVHNLSNFMQEYFAALP